MGWQARDVARQSRIQSLYGAAIAVPTLLFAGHRAGATLISWQGNDSPSWSVGTNWLPQAPVTTDSLEFGLAGTAGTTLIDDLMTPATFSLTGITFNSGASGFVINPKTAGTNGFTLTGEVVNNSTNLQTINDNITISGVRTFTAGAGGADITLG